MVKYVKMIWWWSGSLIKNSLTLRDKAQRQKYHNVGDGLRCLNVILVTVYITNLHYPLHKSNSMDCAVGRTNRLSLMSLLMDVKSNSVAADAGATIMWSGAEVAARLSPFPKSELLFCVPKPRLVRLRTRWLLRGTKFSRLNDPACHCSEMTGPCYAASCCTFRAFFYYKTGPYCRRFPAASCPRNTCFEMRLSGMRITWPTQRSCALSGKASMPIMPQMLNTYVLGILSCQVQTRAILRKQRRRNWSNLQIDRR